MLLGHRYYDASLGRFLSSDPAQSGSNWYAYCDNDPLVRVDPTGRYWWFDPDTGLLYWVDPSTGKPYVKGRGYSGRPGYRKSKDQGKKDLGPIPGGDYVIGRAYHDKRMGPVTMKLHPCPWNNMYGRKYFRMHGDTPNHNASSGCIIRPSKIRQMVNKRRQTSPDGNVLHVGNGSGYPLFPGPMYW